MAFDTLLLERHNAARDYTAEELARAKVRFATMSAAMSTTGKQQLQRNIIAGRPGNEASFTLKQFQQALEAYDGIDGARPRGHLMLFLREVISVAEHPGIPLVIHPDDPPQPIMGLPRYLPSSASCAVLSPTACRARCSSGSCSRSTV